MARAARSRKVLRSGLEQEQSLPFDTLAGAVQWTGTWLAARGVRASNVIALHAPGHIEFIAVRQTASRVGGVLVRLSPRAPRQEAGGQPGRPGARWLATTSQMLVRNPQAPAPPSALAGTLLLSAADAGQAPSPAVPGPDPGILAASAGIPSQVAGGACPGRLARA